MTILDLILGSLATYRLALMVSREDGLFWMFKHLRRVVKREAPKKTHMDEGIECLWCMSAHAAIAVTIGWVYLRGNAVFDATIMALSFSAVAVVLNQAFTKGGK